MNSIKVVLNALLLSAAVSAISCYARDAEEPSVDLQEKYLLVAQKNAPINSFVRLQEHTLNLSSDSPLRALSQPARQRFIASLRFNESGVTSLRYQDIVEELSYSEAYRLLALFGVARVLPKLPPLRSQTLGDEQIRASKSPPFHEDHYNYACTGPHTCSRSSQDICMTGC